MKGDLAAADAELDEVTGLGPDMRISTITGYLEDMDTILANRRFTGARQATDMRERIRAFNRPAAIGT
jgi:hypothetical protein